MPNVKIRFRDEQGNIVDSEYGRFEEDKSMNVIGGDFFTAALIVGVVYFVMTHIKFV